jgi:chaperonin GroES
MPLESALLALDEQKCQNFFDALLKPKKGFHNLFAPVAQKSDRPITSCFASGGFAMHFRPLHDRVVVRRIEAEEKTSGGIIIPDTAKDKPQEGEVLAVGPGTRDDSGQLAELSVKVGDRILFGKWSGTEVKIDDEDLLIMKESDILGVVETQAELKQAA